MSTPQPQSDQRQLRRLPCYLEVNADPQSAPIGTLQDLTLDGAFVGTASALPRGTVLPLSFRLGSDQEPISADVEVVRSLPTGMGVRFLRMSGEDSRALRRYVVGLSDAVGARDSALKLVDADSRLTRPITGTERISALLTASEGIFYLLPTQRAVRITARLERQSALGLELKCEQAESLRQAEPFVCLYSQSFVSYSFRSQVIAVSSPHLTVALPTEVCYSERRSGQRLESDPTTRVNFRLPWVPATDSSFAVCETSSLGMSFKVASDQTPFEPGDILPDLRLVAGGAEKVITGAQVRHVSLLVEDDGERWTRVGISYGPKSEEKKETSERLDVLQAPGTLASRVAAMGRNARSALTYLYHSKVPKTARAQEARGHLVINFENSSRQRIVGLLDSTFMATDGCVRAPLVIVVPGYGSRKETMSALAHTIVDNWKRQSRDIAVLRYDGTNNLGESYKDPGCEGEGKNGLHFNIPGSVEDVLSTLRWAKNNPHISPTGIVIISVSMGSPAVRRALTLSEGASVNHWISFMGAADVASATLNGSGNIDIAGNYERGIKSGVISLVGCLFDADFSTPLAARAGLLSLEDARADMTKINAGVTWFIGKHDAYIDPRNVRDLMNVKAKGSRQIIEVDAGHVPRHSEEALAEFSLITRHLWKIFYGTEMRAVIPSRGWLSACAKREWDRVRKGLSTDSVSYWKDYLVGDNNIGFDAWSYTQEYQQLVRDQTALVRLPQPSHVLDLGAGTGNMTQALLSDGVTRVTAADLVPEALERIRKKVDERRLETIATSADGGPFVALRRWISGDLGSLGILANRLPDELREDLERLSSAMTPDIHAILRGACLNIDSITRQAGLPDTMITALRDLQTMARLVRALVGEEEARRSLRGPAVKILASPRGLPFGQNTFEGVICSLVLSYMSYPDDTLFEIKRVMKPGARLTISSMLPDMDSSKAFVGAVNFVESAKPEDLPGDYDRATLLAALREFADKSSKLVHLEEEGSFRFFSSDELRGMLIRAGFENVETKLSCGEPSLAVIATATKSKEG